jgi:hypothetical protein
MQFCQMVDAETTYHGIQPVAHFQVVLVQVVAETQAIEMMGD